MLISAVERLGFLLRKLSYEIDDEGNFCLWLLLIGLRLRSRTVQHPLSSIDT